MSDTGCQNDIARCFSLFDVLRRPLRDLRISVTDRCNLRCTYCMPRGVFDKNFVFLHRTDLLSFEEITRLVRLGITLGVSKVRLSGGEPLLRHGVERLVEQLARLTDAEGKPLEIAMTTNGTLLAAKARTLKDAGLMRLTISLDALNDVVYRRISDSDVPVGKVLEGIAAAQAVGLFPLKVNTVVKRGINETEILPLVRHFRHTGIILRFIEFMDVGTTNGWRLDDVVTVRDILSKIEEGFALRPINPNYNGEVAQRWEYADGAGEIGVIASVTQAFCHECTRLRLSIDGKLYACLFASGGTDLRTPLRNGENDEQLRQRIVDVWAQRTDRYSQLRQAEIPRGEPLTKRIEMSYIGG